MNGFQVRKRGIVAAGALLGAGMWVGSLQAQENKAPAGTQSDAQVEANVLKALASAPELSTQNIQTTTSFGEVTMTGNVHDEAMRTKAENLVARTSGVKKVIDEMSLGDAPAESAQGAPPEAGQAPGNQDDAPELANMAPGPEGQQQLPPDRQYEQEGNAPGQNPQYSQSGPPPAYGNQEPQQPYGSQAPYGAQPPQGYEGNQPPQGYGNQPPQGYGNQPGYGNGAPPPPPGYGNGGPQYSQQGPPPDYSGQPYPPQQRRPMYQQAPPPPPGYGQAAGMPVTIPPGALLRVRVNRGIDSQHIQPGTPFDGTVLSDVVAGGAVAIPRGAMVSGVVVGAQKTKELSGRGELALQITGVALGGQIYPVQSDIWHRVGSDKTASTVNHAVGLGALGAVVGAIAGGGPGAAVGAGVGAGVGVATSAGTPGGQVIVPAEAVLMFHTTAPAEVRTVSEQEMQRLAYNAGPGGRPRPYYAGPRYSPYGGPVYVRPYPYGGAYYYGR